MDVVKVHATINKRRQGVRNLIPPIYDICKMNLPFALAATTLFAGTLDAIGASVHFSWSTKRDPANLWKFVASGVFGSRALEGGKAMAAYGLLFHYAIAFACTAMYFLLYNVLPVIRSWPHASGVAYAFIVWVFMTKIVLPLSKAPKRVRSPRDVAISIGILIVCIGLPISALTHYFYTH
jgi:hypothetical protein